MATLDDASKAKVADTFAKVWTMSQWGVLNLMTSLSSMSPSLPSPFGREGNAHASAEKRLHGSAAARFGTPEGEGSNGPGDWRFEPPKRGGLDGAFTPQRAVTIMTPAVPSFPADNQSQECVDLKAYLSETRTAQPYAEPLKRESIRGAGVEAPSQGISYSVSAHYRRLGRAKP